MVASTVKKGKDLLRKGNRHHLPCGFYILGLSPSVTKSHRVAQNVPYIQVPLFKCYLLKVPSSVCLKCIGALRWSFISNTRINTEVVGLKLVVLVAHKTTMITGFFDSLESLRSIKTCSYEEKLDVGLTFAN